MQIVRAIIIWANFLAAYVGESFCAKSHKMLESSNLTTPSWSFLEKYFEVFNDEIQNCRSSNQ